MLRSILAVVTGYIVMAAATMLCVLGLSLAFGLPLSPPTQSPPEPSAHAQTATHADAQTTTQALARSPEQAATQAPAQSAPLPTAYVILNLLVSTFCAAAGGFTAAVVAGRAPLRHALALAAVVLVLGVLYAIPAARTGGSQPLWYLAVLPVVGSAGVVAGGLAAQRPPLADAAQRS